MADQAPVRPIGPDFPDQTLIEDPSGPERLIMATFVSDGRYIDYTPGAAVAAGAVIVQGDLIGVAHRSIPANVKGALCVGGVVNFPKATGAIAAGTSLHWDATNGVATATATGNKLIGKAVAAALSADTSVDILLRQ